MEGFMQVREPTGIIEIPPPQTTRCASLEEFRSFMASPLNREADIAAFERGLIQDAEKFTISGWDCKQNKLQNQANLTSPNL
jgi:hypothetical protein